MPANPCEQAKFLYCQQDRDCGGCGPCLSNNTCKGALSGREGFHQSISKNAKMGLGLAAIIILLILVYIFFIHKKTPMYYY